MNKFLLVGDKFIPEMNLIQTGFRFNACRPFIRNKKKNKKNKDNRRFKIYLPKIIRQSLFST